MVAALELSRRRFLHCAATASAVLGVSRAATAAPVETIDLPAGLSCYANAISSAIARLPVPSVAQLPPGTFPLCEGVELRSGVGLRGSSEQPTRFVLKTAFHGAAAFQWTSETPRLLFENLELTAEPSSANQTGGPHGFHIVAPSACGSGSESIVFDSCRFFDFTGQRAALHVKGAKFINIKNCTFENVGHVPYYHAIYLRRVSDVLVENCSFTRCPAAGLKVQSIDCGDRVRVINCRFEGGLRGLHAQDTGDIEVRGCEFKKVHGRGISFTLSRERGKQQPLSTIDACRFVDCDAALFVNGAAVKVSNSSFQISQGSALEALSCEVELLRNVFQLQSPDATVVKALKAARGYARLQANVIQGVAREPYQNMAPTRFRIEQM